MIEAGQFRHRVSVQQLAGGQDETGQEEAGWAEIAQRWASIEPLSGREFFQGKQLEAEVTVRIRMRYLRGLTPKMRVVYGARAFDVQHVINVEERNRELELLCIERV